MPDPDAWTWVAGSKPQLSSLVHCLKLQYSENKKKKVRNLQVTCRLSFECLHERKLLAGVFSWVEHWALPAARPAREE